ncbi:dihydrofolate reductase family protein [Luedemannella helvata]|uniref:Dihydrofolate reductase family protein n=1 Tax=Luedemannella helvata TaxID=349315 RepID=A0ABN2KB66_9ACTN
MAGSVVVDITMSVDGFVAGPNEGMGRGLGEGGEPIHNWIMGGEWSYDNGPTFQASGADRAAVEALHTRYGAVIVGRRMYDVVDGWGDEVAFPQPVFVVTSRPHPRREVGTSSYTFVTDGIQAALERARQAAGQRPVVIGGGARVVQQYLAAGLVDEIALHIAPVLMGAGRRLFEHIGDHVRRLEIVRVAESPNATHLHYRVGRP